MKILRVEYQNIGVFKKGLIIDLTAKDRVFYDSPVSNVHKTINTNNITCLIGINASGKTTALNLIDIAIKIVAGNYGLNQFNISPRLLPDGSKMVVDFFTDDTFYRLESIIGEKADGNKSRLYFREETIFLKPKKEVVNRKQLFHYEERHIKYKRSYWEKEEFSLIKDQDSISAFIKKDSSVVNINYLDESNINIYTVPGRAYMDIINLFDDSIESIHHKEHSVDITFKDSYKHSSDRHGRDVLSSGTIRGGNLLFDVKHTLSSGGIILVDELENHMNKRLIQVILELFADNDINKKGAMLVFSTHYAEILETITRKDSIYVMLRKKNYTSVAERYADVVKRNDVKKSEVILSNYINGTAPKYEYIEKLREFMCEDTSSSEGGHDE